MFSKMKIPLDVKSPLARRSSKKRSPTSFKIPKIQSPSPLKRPQSPASDRANMPSKETPLIYQNKDPISACNKIRVEEGGHFTSRVQVKEDPEFFMELKLLGPGLGTTAKKIHKKSTSNDLSRYMRIGSTVLKRSPRINEN